MPFLKNLVAGLRTLFRKSQDEREMDEELKGYLDAAAKDKMQDGMSPEEARRAVRVEMGSVEAVKDEIRSAGWESAVDTLWQDIRYGLRQLRRTPIFTFVAVATLALGVGANTALFSVMDAMLLRPLPIRNPQGLVEFVRLHPDGNMMTNLPYSLFEHMRRNTSVLSGVFAFTADRKLVRSRMGAEHFLVHEVSGAFFSTLGVNPLLGRTFSFNDEHPDADPHLVVLSYSFWSLRYGRDPSVVGTTVRVNGAPCLVIGVMPAGFFGVDPSQIPDMWVPLSSADGAGEVWVLARLKPGVTIPQARAQLQPLFQEGLQSLGREMKDWPARDRAAFLAERLLINRATAGTSGLRWRFWDYSHSLKLLLGMTVLALLISCANLANLLMARAVARSHEIAIRFALGSGLRRILRQLLTENLILALAGGVFGLVVAAWGHGLLLAFLVGDSGGVSLEFRLDYRVLGFSLAVSVLTGALSGLLPALRLTKKDLALTINASGQASISGRLPFARNFLAIEVGLSLVLLVGAGLFVRSLRNLTATDPGIARESLAIMRVGTSLNKSLPVRKQFWRQLTSRVGSLPGVRSASLAGDAVFGSGGWNTTIWIREADGRERDVRVPFNLVGPAFFETVGIPLLTGREFGDRDEEKYPSVAVVNRAFAEQYFGGANPIGRRFGDQGPGSSSRIEVVGIIGDAKYSDLREEPRPMMYKPLYQNFEDRPYQLHVRTVGDPGPEIPAIRHEIQEMSGDISVDDVRTIGEIIRGVVQHDRMFAVLSSMFGLLAVALTCVGVYGVASYQAVRRTREIGIRMALGAGRSSILKMFVCESLLVLSAGIAVGLPAAIVAAHMVRNLFYGLEPFDLSTIIIALVALVGTVTLASLLPARRATKVDPMVALRYE